MSLPITNSGLALLASGLKNLSPEPKYFGWGTSTTSATLTDTALNTAAPEARVAATTSIVTQNVTNDCYQGVGTLTSAAGATIAELGQFDASTSGNMLSHFVFTGVPLGAGDSIQFTTQHYGT